MEMEGIEHKMVRVNGIYMHVAEKGQGPMVLFLHEFPELWYSWRHQIIGLTSHGYRAVAPDLRGYGDTDAPPSPTSYTYFQIVGDLTSKQEREKGKERKGKYPNELSNISPPRSRRLFAISLGEPSETIKTSFLA